MVTAVGPGKTRIHVTSYSYAIDEQHEDTVCETDVTVTVLQENDLTVTAKKKQYTAKAKKKTVLKAKSIKSR